MPCKIKNPANIDLSSLGGHVQDLYSHFNDKIGFNKPPTMIFDSEPSNELNVLGKTAYYDPNSIEIHVYTDGRHPKDMLRSIAHELIHHWQNEEGRLQVGGYSGPGYYLKNKDLKDLEDEAMKLGNGYFREYEDNLKLKEKKEMSLNEWKNNELNQLLMKRFGILKEEKGKYDDGDGKDEKCDHVPCSEANEGMDYKRDDEGYEKNPEDFTGTRKQMNQNISNLKKGKALQEDSGEDEAWNDWKNEHADDDHIKEIERHLRALKGDRDYDRDKSEYDNDDYEDDRKDEHRNRQDKLVGHEDRDPSGLVTEDEASEDAATSEKSDDGASPEDALLESRNLKSAVRNVLKENKKLRLRFKK
jgi:hypothetical protein